MNVKRGKHQVRKSNNNQSTEKRQTEVIKQKMIHGNLFIIWFNWRETQTIWLNELFIINRFFLFYRLCVCARFGQAIKMKSNNIIEKKNDKKKQARSADRLLPLLLVISKWYYTLLISE